MGVTTGGKSCKSLFGQSFLPHAVLIDLEEYCKRFAPIALGEAVVTPGFNLKNPYVIHARAASYINDEEPEKFLGLAVTNTLRVAQTAGIKTLAMPAMGTGVFKFPAELAAETILKALKRGAQEFPDIELVRICVLEEGTKAFFNQSLAFVNEDYL